MAVIQKIVWLTAMQCFITELSWSTHTYLCVFVYVCLSACTCMYMFIYELFSFYSVWCASSALEVIEMNIREETEYGLKVKVWCASKFCHIPDKYILNKAMFCILS